MNQAAPTQPAIHTRLTRLVITSGPRKGCAVNSPYIPPKAEPMSNRCTHTPLPMRSMSVVASAITIGPTTPTIPLRLATENSAARLTYASSGSTHSAQLTIVSASERPEASRLPLRSTSPWPPTRIRPATRLDAIARMSMATAKVAAASSLPVNSSPSEHDRVRIVFHVLWRSSEANWSPATSPAISGKPHEPAKPMTTRETANPEECT